MSSTQGFDRGRLAVALGATLVAGACGASPAPHPGTGAIVVTSGTSTTTSEAGGQLTLTIALDAAPTGIVVVPVVSSDATEGTASPSSVTFTPDNWNAAHTITVTGVDDGLFDGTQTFHIGFGPAASADVRFNTITAVSADLTNVDDENAGISLGVASGSTTEHGGTATFTVVLTGAPTASVTLALASSDTSEGTVLPASIVFTTTNWNAPRTITVYGVDDLLTDGPQTFDVAVTSVTSNDSHYASLALPSPVTFTNTDDESPGITIGAASGHVTEAGGTATFTAVLNAQPNANVVLHFATNDPTEGVTNVSALTFTNQNWNSAQTVTVTGVNDAIADGNQSFAVVFTATTSADATYAALPIPANVAVTNDDDDAAAIHVSAAVGSPSESGGTATFTVVLVSQPTAAITLHLDTSDATEGTPDMTSLVFDAGTWNVPRTVTVTGVDDTLIDGDQAFSIVFSAQTGGDPAYVALPPPGNLSFLNIDDETPGYLVTMPTGHTSEPTGSATFSVSLRTAPTASVTLHFDTNDVTEGLPSVTSLVFGTGDWSVPQTVTVAGVDDPIADGDQSYAIVFTANTTSDAVYAALAQPASIVLVNDDDESASVDVVVVSSDTSEVGGTATFTVALGCQPSAPVTVHFDTTDASEGTPSATSLTFDTGDWNVPQTVVVTGQNDLIVDGVQAYAIAFTANTGADAAYAALVPPSSVPLANADDDYATFRIKTTYSEGGVAFYVANAGGYYHVVIARLNEPSLTGTDFVWKLSQGLANVNDAALVSIEPISYPGRYLRIDSAMPTRYPPCGEGSAYGWALCGPPASEQNYLLWTDAFVESSTFRSDATFRRVAALNADGSMVTFQWYGGSTRYLRHNWYNMKAFTLGGSGTENNDSSFTIEMFGQVVQ